MIDAQPIHEQAAHEAEFYQRLPNNRVRCVLCPHNCRIVDGGRGACGVRVNHHGTLHTLVYDKVVSRTVEPIEKKPLFHFLPGSKTYSIATVGCCLRCAHCQNWAISQWPKTALPRTVEWETEQPEPSVCPELGALRDAIPGEHVTPDDIVGAALASGCRSIAYTFTEPTIFFELAHETAVRARDAGLANVFVTSGFINEAPLRRIGTVLDAVNVDLKFFRERSYTHISRARLRPVLDAIRLYHDLGVWTEATTLLIPGINDSDDELKAIAELICTVGREIPWHVSQFYPAYKMFDRPSTPVATLRRARQIGLEAGLRYVYQGNVPGAGGETTCCWHCDEVLVKRYGNVVRENRIGADGHCPACHAEIDGAWRSVRSAGR